VKRYADTSFLLSLYREQDASGRAAELMAGMAEPLPLTPLEFLELRTGLNLAVFRREISATTRDAAWAHVLQDIRDGVLVRTSPSPTDVFERAGELSDKHAAAIGARTLDILHVASALVLGARELLSFDQRQRALAEKCGLKVKP